MGDEENNIWRVVGGLQPRIERAERDLVATQVDVESLKGDRIRSSGRLDAVSVLVDRHVECLEDHEERIVKQERRSSEATAVMQRLSQSVDNLAKAVQPHKPVAQQAKEAWDDSSRKTKLAIFATILAFVNAPEITKQLTRILSNLLGRMLPH